MLRTLAVLLFVTSVAHAETKPEAITTPLVDIPFDIGGGNDGFLIGIRPEILVAHATLPRDWSDGMRGFAIGATGELARVGGNTVYGGGLAFVRLGRRARIEPSIGVYDRVGEARGITASLFVGVHKDDDSRPWETAAGFRVIGRVDTSGTTQQNSVELALQIDPMALKRSVEGFVQIFTPH